MRAVLVPEMSFVAAAVVALAWLGHLRFKSLGFWPALGMRWNIVLP